MLQISFQDSFFLMECELDQLFFTFVTTLVRQIVGKDCNKINEICYLGVYETQILLMKVRYVQFVSCAKGRNILCGSRMKIRADQFNGILFVLWSSLNCQSAMLYDLYPSALG